MAVIAPWLRPPDVLEAMRSGASLGLQLRAQNIAQQEAAARREQEAAELEARQQTAADTLRVQRETGAARLAMAASAAAALAGHRGEQRKLDEAAHALRVRAENRMQRKETFEEEQARKKAENQAIDLIYDDTTRRWYQRRNNQLYPVTPATGARLSPLEKVEDKRQTKKYEDAALVLEDESKKTPGFLGLGGPNKEKVAQATKDFQSASNALLRSTSPQALPPKLETKDLPSAPGLAEKVRADYRAGKIPKAEALRMLKDLGFE